MARIAILLVVLSIGGGFTNDDNPFLDLTSSLLQNMGNGENNGLGALGSIVGNLMQGDNAKNLGALLGQNSNAGDLLSGLGSLLGGQNGNIDPSTIGTVMSMFAQMGDQPKRQKRNSDDLNLDGIMNLASGLLGNQNAGGIMSMVMNTLSSLSEDEVQKRSDAHKDHASFLPPFMEKAHLYWDLFINSDLGKAIWEKSGLRKATKAFTAADGSFSFEMMFKSFENLSFRRHWIKAVANYLTDMVVHVAKPDVYKRYVTSAEYITNTFLDSQGLPKSVHVSAKRPEESVTRLTNYVLKRYLDMDADVSEYLVPAFEYIRQTLKMAQTASQKLAKTDYNALGERLTDTLNLEVIEPVLRVHRAYRHALAAPQCQEHLMCVVNSHHDKDGRLPGFKAGLTKLSSLVASAALSFQDGKGFWDLYNAVQSDVNCEAKYPADCTAFHEHELKVTTEVYHNEL